MRADWATRVRMERGGREVSDKIVVEISSASLVNSVMWLLGDHGGRFRAVLSPQKGGNEA